MMRRLMVRIGILAFALSTLAVSMVMAAPALQARFGNLESLSNYFPKDTMLYAATRTDTNFVALLDRLAQMIESQLPQGTIPNVFPKTVTTALDLLDNRAGGSYATNIRPWLGDTLAVGIYPTIHSAGGRIVIKITDPQAAHDAVLKLLPDWTGIGANGYTLLAPTDATDHNRIAIYADVMIIYGWSDDVGPQETPTVTPNVTANPYYTTALSRLPETNYDMIAFVDTPLMLAYNQRKGSQDLTWLLKAAILRVIGATGFGAHVNSDQTLTVDVAQSLGNTTGLDALGVHFTAQGATLNPDSLTHIPRDAFVVAQVADVGSMIEFVGSSAQNAAKKFQTVLPSIITSAAYGYSASTAGLVSAAFSSIINTEWANVFFSNLSGYDYNSEIRPLLGGDSTLFLTFNPSYNPNSPIFVNREPFDGALVLEATNAQAAQQFVSKLQRELAITIYSSGDDNHVRIQEAALPAGAQGVSLTVYGETGQPFDQFIFTSQDNRLVIGTARSVSRVLSGDGLGFEATSSAMLPDAGAAVFVNVPQAQSPEWTAFKQSDPGNTVLQLFPYFVQNMTITAAGTEQNDLLLRLTMTLPCGDNCG